MRGGAPIYSFKTANPQFPILGGGTPENSWQELGIPGPVLQILTLFQTKTVIFVTCFQTWSGLQEIKSSLLRLKRQQKQHFLKFVSNSHICLSFSFGRNDKYFHTLTQFPIFPFSGQNGAETIPFGAAHTFISYMGVAPPQAPLSQLCKLSYWTKLSVIMNCNFIFVLVRAFSNISISIAIYQVCIRQYI